MSMTINFQASWKSSFAIFHLLGLNTIQQISAVEINVNPKIVKSYGMHYINMDEDNTFILEQSDLSSLETDDQENLINMSQVEEQDEDISGQDLEDDDKSNQLEGEFNSLATQQTKQPCIKDQLKKLEKIICKTQKQLDQMVGDEQSNKKAAKHLSRVIQESIKNINQSIEKAAKLDALSNKKNKKIDLKTVIDTIKKFHKISESKLKRIEKQLKKTLKTDKVLKKDLLKLKEATDDDNIQKRIQAIQLKILEKLKISIKTNIEQKKQKCKKEPEASGCSKKKNKKDKSNELEQKIAELQNIVLKLGNQIQSSKGSSRRTKSSSDSDVAQKLSKLESEYQRLRNDLQKEISKSKQIENSKPGQCSAQQSLTSRQQQEKEYFRKAKIEWDLLQERLQQEEKGCGEAVQKKEVKKDDCKEVKKDDCKDDKQKVDQQRQANKQEIKESLSKQLKSQLKKNPNAKTSFQKQLEDRLSELKQQIIDKEISITSIPSDVLAKRMRQNGIPVFEKEVTRVLFAQTDDPQLEIDAIQEFNAYLDFYGKPYDDQ